jgi:dUTPase
MKFVKIKSIKKIESEDIYHLTVQKNHNFFGNGLCLHNCGYTIPNEIKIIIFNLSDKQFPIKNKDRIAQGVLSTVPTAIFEEVEDEDEEDSSRNRGGGFGSTDK